MSSSTRALILVTGLSLGAGCLATSNAATPGGQTTTTPSAVPPKIYRNPPPPQRMARRPPITGKADKTAPAGAMDTLLSETLPGGQQVYAHPNGGCYIPYGPGLENPPDTSAFQTEVTCPESMMKMEWGHCTGRASLFSDSAGEVCTCAPEPGITEEPPYGVPCPK